MSLSVHVHVPTVPMRFLKSVARHWTEDTWNAPWANRTRRRLFVLTRTIDYDIRVRSSRSAQSSCCLHHDWSADVSVKQIFSYELYCYWSSLMWLCPIICSSYFVLGFCITCHGLMAEWDFSLLNNCWLNLWMVTLCNSVWMISFACLLHLC